MTLTTAEPSSGENDKPKPVPKSAGSSGRTVSDQLFELVEEQELFRTPDFEAFVSLEMDGHRETWPVESTTVRSWLIKTAHDRFDAKLPAAKLNDLLALIKAHALLGGNVLDVHVRVGGHDGKVYLDLGDSDWRAVEISAEGWKIVEAPPLHFRRDRSSLPLPVPVEGGSLDELRGFVNVGDDAWMLVCSWLAAALWPAGPYPVLDLVGEQGSAKSTTARLVRALVDPNKAPLRSEPRSAQDLMISATNARVIALDNLSKIRDWLSDGLCRLATGGGHSTRRLYTDNEEIVLDAQRPVILTGIGDHATRSDLLDRELLITLNPITEAQRLPEALFWARFEEARPRLLGVLLDVVSHVLRTVNDVELSGHPRMADFARVMAAAAPAFGWTAEVVLEAYEGNRRDLNALALDDSPLTHAVREAAREGFHGPAADLLATLAKHDEDASKRPGWSKTPRQLSASLNRLAPNFRAEGIEITTGRETTGKKQRYIDITSPESQRRATIRAEMISPGPTRSEKGTPTDHDCESQDADKAETQTEAGEKRTRLPRKTFAELRVEYGVPPRRRADSDGTPAPEDAPASDDGDAGIEIDDSSSSSASADAQERATVVAVAEELKPQKRLPIRERFRASTASMQAEHPPANDASGRDDASDRLAEGDGSATADAAAVLSEAAPEPPA